MKHRHTVIREWPTAAPSPNLKPRVKRLRSLFAVRLRLSKFTIARKGRSVLARMIWRQANRVGLAFRAMVTDTPESDLDARLLRRSEKKKRQLQRRINQLLGEG